jgi:diaminopimelate decarboxylase
MIQKSIGADRNGNMLFAGAEVSALAEKYGTPFYAMDERRLRENMRTYVTAMKKAFGPGALPTYASKALCFKELYRILDAEGMGADVVSGGELYTAYSAGFPMDRVFFHGTYKSTAEIELALDLGVGFYMADSEYDIENISRLAGEKGKRANVIIRLTPGIDPHTFAAVNTGKLDCQFGTPIETGQARELVEWALKQSNIHIAGFHCHVGSQIFGFEPFSLAVGKMTDFMAQVKAELGYEAEYLDLGGGFGVRYVESDAWVDIAGCIERLGGILERACAEKGLKKPVVLMEPGRSIVADAGITVYRAGAVKDVRGHRTYVVVDGGMTDNPRYALYGAAYTVYHAGRMNDAADRKYTIAGRCCESGALLQEDVMLPEVKSGDLIAFGVTGAYNYSMASNYNRVPRLPVVMLAGGEDRLAVRRETYEDIIKYDI